MKHTLLLTVLVVSLGLAGCEALKQEGKSDAAKAAPRDDTPSAQVTPERLITSQTSAVKAYRKVGAGYIYKKYPNRIYKGKIPPLVYAVVVTETDVDSTGKVTGVYFSRTPSHAPEVAPMIEELIKDASPFPNPGKVGAHTYVDTWLWDKSGKFQLDTLTLGQRNR
ncbi:hypothetical protein QTH97_05810 [Variovorax sp. J22R24]|uniref:hypothetical protein n=1 Tax=Variovorax gracilis TaxID=3053502 RepID=UPI00257627B0|nr:hypothetical protein [Variovorax sp. J22R24]MDM0104438.1 hypothetical protein [Variovorax sp. J22R24]